MPLYHYKCSNCGREYDVYRLIASRNRMFACAHCGEKAERDMANESPAVVPDTLPRKLRGYWDAADRSFTTRTELREYCKANNKICRFLDGDSNIDVRRRKSKQEKLRDFRERQRSRPAPRFV